MSDIKVNIVLTDYTWAESSRPIITLSEKQDSAHVQLGDGPNVQPIMFQLTGADREDLSSQLKGLSEIFAKAAEVTST
jgi:hypothetical protein